MVLRAAIYARVSDDSQRTNYSIPSQIEACLHHIDERGYIVVGNQFVDPVTGFDIPESEQAIVAFVDDYTSTEISRPSLDNAIAYLREFGFDVLVVHSLDRLARDLYTRKSLEIELKKLGARVEYVLGNYEDSPEGELRKDLEATFANWENVKRVERSLRGKRGKAQRGLFVAGRPTFGYRIDPQGAGGLSVNDDEAAIVKRIYSLFVHERLSIRRIAQVLTEDGVPTPKGRKKWGKSTINRILQNTTYAGYFYYNKHAKDGKRLVKRDKAQWIRIETSPVIDAAVFEEAQRRMDENRRIVRRQPKRFYLLGGMVLCNECGRPYITQTALPGRSGRINEAQSYRHRINHGHCRNHQISARILDPLVWQEITRILLDPENLRKGYEQSVAEHRAAHQRQFAMLDTLRQSHQKLHARKENLTTAYIDPDIELTKDEYLSQRMKIDDELKHIASQIEALEASLTELPTPVELEKLEHFAGEIRASLHDDFDLTPEEKRQILEILHIRVYISDDGTMRLTGWFDAESSGLLGNTSEHCGLPPRPLRARV